MRRFNQMRWPRLPKYNRGWLVWNPGGGGAGTVQTDGVTIQGDGSAGNKIAIKQVETDATLTGAGTVASKLGLPVVPAFITYGLAAANFTVTANKLLLSTEIISVPTRFSQIQISIFSADGANNSDVGLYNFAGNLVAHAGAQLMGTAGVQIFSTVEGIQTIPQGVYFFAATSAGSILTLSVLGSTLLLYSNLAFGSSSGGALPSSITPPTFGSGNFRNTFALL